MIRMIRMIILSQTPAWRLGSAQWDVAEAANLPDVRKCSKRYNFNYFRARRRSSLLSQGSLIRSPPQARLCVFSLGNINGWRNIVLQTAATATLWAWDGPESS